VGVETNGTERAVLDLLFERSPGWRRLTKEERKAFGGDVMGPDGRVHEAKTTRALKLETIFCGVYDTELELMKAGMPVLLANESEHVVVEGPWFAEQVVARGRRMRQVTVPLV
jgi:hypothetical protein